MSRARLRLPGVPRILDVVHPRLFHFGHVIVPTYGVLAAAGLVVAILLAEWCAPRAGVSADRVGSLCLWTATGTLVLSRVALVVQSPGAFARYPALLLSLPTVTRFGLVLALASGGGYALLRRMPVLRTLDAVAPAALLLAVFLHLGSFFAGTDFGSGTALALGNTVPGDEGHHPVALYAAVLSVLGLVLTTGVLLRQRQPGTAFGMGLSALAISRYVADEFRPGYLLPQARVPGFLRVDQIVLIALAIVGMLLLLERKRDHA